MIVYTNRFVKKHIVGGSGIMDTLKNLLRRAATSSASRAASTLASRIAKTELGREAVMASKSARKELASAAISTAKDVAIDKGRKTIEKLYAKTGTPKPIEVAKSALNQKSKDIISEIVSMGEQLKNVVKNPYIDEYDMMGSGLTAKPSAKPMNQKLSIKNVIRIQDIVKMKKGNGLLIA